MSFCKSIYYFYIQQIKFVKIHQLVVRYSQFSIKIGKYTSRWTVDDGYDIW